MGVGRTRDDKYICISVDSTVASEARCAPAADPGEVHRAGAARARRRIPGRPPRRPLGDPHQLPTAPRTSSSSPRRRRRPRAQRLDATWCRTATTSSSTASNCSTASSPSPSAPAACKRLRLLQRRRQEHEFVNADEPAYAMGLTSIAEAGHRLAALHLHLADHAGHDLRTQHDDRRAQRCSSATRCSATTRRNYVTERVWATARDGTQDPGVARLPARASRRTAPRALLQYAYGSYGSSTDPALQPAGGQPARSRHGLRDRAHPRRPGDGPRLVRRRQAAEQEEHLHRLHRRHAISWSSEGYAAKDRVAAYGGSAGGLLMGAIANMAPEDYRVILSQVPFVDVVTTMLDAIIPLTTNEYDEWGNPEKQEYYDYMLSYSPYDNLARAGLSGDVRRHRPVGFAGAVLRAGEVRGAPARPKTDAQPGAVPHQHGCRPRRQVRPLPPLPRTPNMYAFLLDQLGVSNEAPTPAQAPPPATAPRRGERG